MRQGCGCGSRRGRINNAKFTVIPGNQVMSLPYWKCSACGFCQVSDIARLVRSAARDDTRLQGNEYDTIIDNIMEDKI